MTTTDKRSFKLAASYHQYRQRLQGTYAELSGLPDASRLAYLHGDKHSWNEADVANMWSTAPSHTESGTEVHNHMYVHVPFCKSICSFCNYERLRPSHPSLLHNYLRRVLASIDAIAPKVRHLRFSSLYFGGGTPSVLPAPMLSQLLQAIDDAFDFYPDNGRAFEFDPAVMNAEKLAVTQRHGFSRYSFGIQTLEAGVMKQHNRGAQGRDMVAKRFKEMDEAGVSIVSCDILLGLAGTTAPQLLREIEEILANHKPKEVDIFMLTPTHEYVESHFNGSFEAFWQHIAPFEQQVPAALPAIAERNGYFFGGGQSHSLTLKRMPSKLDRPNKSRRSYTQLSCQAANPIHLLGLGPSARSSIFSKAIFQCKEPKEAAANFTYQGHPITLKDEARLYLAHQLRDQNHLDLTEFRRIIGKDFHQLHPVALAAWQKSHLAQQENNTLHLQPQPRRERTRSLLWLVPDENLEFELARRWRIPLQRGGLERLLQPIQLGQAITPKLSLHQLHDRKIVLRSADQQQYAFRVAPGWSENDHIRLVILSQPSKAIMPELTKAVKLLRRLMQRNLGQLRSRMQ